MTTFVELYAGLAAVSLHLHGLKPPVSRIGAKTGYAHAIVDALSLRRVERFVLIDTDPSVVQVLRSLVSQSGRLELVGHLSEWRQSREVWEALRHETFYGHREAARWLYVTAGRRGGIGGFRGGHKHWPNADGFYPTMPHMVDRILAMSSLRETAFDIRHCRARDVPPIPGAIAYLDPPYCDSEPYPGGNSGGADAVDVFNRWLDAGCVVAMSERSETMADLRASRLDISDLRRGQARRSMTTSCREFLWVGSACGGCGRFAKAGSTCLDYPKCTPAKIDRVVGSV